MNSSFGDKFHITDITENPEKLATGLGWFSIALGLAEILLPDRLAELIGVKKRPVLFRALGLREITSGIGILAEDRPAGWLWSRVAGDAMDLSLLGVALASDDSDREKVGMASAAVIGVTALDVGCALGLSGRRRGVHVKRSITIDRFPDELYAFWRNFENLPRFMHHLESVRTEGSNRSHWVAKGPAGSTVEWDAELIQDKPNELIGWRSLPGSEVENAGTVRFELATGGRGTVVTVQLEYNPPAGVFGAAVAKLFGKAPEQEIQSDLFRFKQVMETGQVVTTEGQPAGRPKSTSPMYDTNNVHR